MNFSKKGIELSMNFLVVFILSIVIFGFGIKFIYEITSNAQGIQGLSQTSIDGQLRDLTCSSENRVCLSETKLRIKRGELGVFNAKIINVETEARFQVTVEPSSTPGIDRNGNPIHQYLDILYRTSDFPIKRYDHELFGVGIAVPKTAPTGTYIFNMKIDKVGSGNYLSGRDVEKLYVDVTD